MPAQPEGLTISMAMALNPLSQVSQQHRDFRSRKHIGEESMLCSQPDLDSNPNCHSLVVWPWATHLISLNLFPYLEDGKIPRPTHHKNVGRINEMMNV